GSVLASLVAFVLAYAIVFGAGITYLVRMARRGPLPQEPAPERERGEKTPMRPLSVPDAEDVDDRPAPPRQVRP
ncbi:MAG: cytochrome ubiquinol oxidase subunit I, partial [Gammaproteobacteria bacterium]